MKKYAKVINEQNQVEVGLGTNTKFYQSIGMVEMDVEQAYNGSWYLEGYAPEKPIEEKQAEVRAVRNSYLEKYVDPKQLVLVWDSLSADDKKLYADYRQYLLDYTEVEDWYLQNPMTLDEWKQSVDQVSDQPTDQVDDKWSLVDTVNDTVSELEK